MMRIKSPPLQLVYDISKGASMDTDSFKHYTQSGKLVKFVVWPALFLHSGGALLAKGVVQPMKEADEKKYLEQVAVKNENEKEVDTKEETKL